MHLKYQFCTVNSSAQGDINELKFVPVVFFYPNLIHFIAQTLR